MMRYVVRVYEDIEVVAENEIDAIEQVRWEFEQENQHDKVTADMVILGIKEK